MVFDPIFLALLSCSLCISVVEVDEVTFSFPFYLTLLHLPALPLFNVLKVCIYFSKDCVTVSLDNTVAR